MSYQVRGRYQSDVLGFAGLRMPSVLAGAIARTAIVAGIVLLLSGYIAQISSLTTGGYKIKDLEKTKTVLNAENEKLRSEIASYQSMSNIRKRLESAGMVKASNISYVKAGTDSTVAKR